jgi:GNAT superfamily N-acetyltransferase
MRPKSRRKQRRATHFQIRRATLKDLETLVEQRHRMFEDLRPRTPAEHVIGDEAYRKFVPDMLQKRRFAAFLAITEEGRPVAGACVWLKEMQPHPGTTRPKKSPYLMSVYTMPEYRGLGLARRLVKEAMKWSKRKGFLQMSLHASRMGRHLYKDLGWERTWEMRINL